MKKIITTICLIVGTALVSFGGVQLYSAYGSDKWHFWFDSDGGYGINFFADYYPLEITAAISAFGWYDFNNPTELFAGTFTGPGLGYFGEFKAGDAIGVWIQTDGSLGEVPGIYTFNPIGLGNYIGSGVGGVCMIFYDHDFSKDINFLVIDMNAPPGQPLPGVMAALAIGGCIFLGRKLKNRVKR